MRALILLLSSFCLLACARHDALDREDVELPRHAVIEHTDVRFSPPDWPEAPPFFFFHGGSDRLVPVDHATDMIDALQEVGVKTEFYLMRGRGHVSSFLTSQHAIHAAAEFMISVGADGGIDAGAGFNDDATQRRQIISSRLP